MQIGIIDDIFAMFTRHGSEHYGEDVTQLEHVLQAAQIAREDGASDDLTLAALLHDIGQFIDDAGLAADQEQRDARHEIAGAAFLARAFPASISEPVRLHVAAKRYLCALEDGYRQALSRASETSLLLQGGPFAATELAAFEAEPWFREAVALRRYDDMGKRKGWNVPGLESYRPLIERALR